MTATEHDPQYVPGVGAPESVQDVQGRLALIQRQVCRCGDTPHENALHDLALVDVPWLLATELDRIRAAVIEALEQAGTEGALWARLRASNLRNGAPL